MDSEQEAKAELATAVDKILESTSPRKLIVAGPGTGKTTIFRKLLEKAPGDKRSRLVLSFIKNLVADLDRDLGSLARVSTLHGYCQSLLHRSPSLRGKLTSDFRCVPGLASLIGTDWEILKTGEVPKFVKAMRMLIGSTDLDFYFERGDYYDAVDFDDSVYRVALKLRVDLAATGRLDLVLVDEFQDFNPMEAQLIDTLASQGPIVIAGDDDQALYSRLRDASWTLIRGLHSGGAYEVFELPFCMRCPEVIVGAVNDVVTKARTLLKLDGRISKPYKYFAPKKGRDSQQYPKITLVESSVQSATANYLGQYIVEAITTIPHTEIEEAARAGEPAVLIIGPKHYLDSVADALTKAGHTLERGADTPKRVELEEGLRILAKDPRANVGWRIALEHSKKEVRDECVRTSATKGVALVDVIPDHFRLSIEAEVAAFKDASEKLGTAPQAATPNPPMRIKLTTFEGSKGMSAQHVFILGLQDGDLPRKAASVEDLEVCRFLVGLTRTKKRCCLLLTGRFAGQPRVPSEFVKWIRKERYHKVRIDANYWKKTP